MTRNNHLRGVRQVIWAAFLLAFAFTMAQPARGQTQRITNGNNINNTNTGNVGIRTTISMSALCLVNTSSDAPRGLIVDQNSPDACASTHWL
jgi:hypothetical protein